MKCTISKDLLVEKISEAGKFTSDRLTSLSILKGIYIKLQGGKMHFYSTNLNMFYHSTIPLDIPDEVSIIIDPKKVLEFIQLLYPGDVSFSMEGDSIILSQGKVSGSFAAIQGDDFPLPPVLVEDAQSLDVSFISDKLPFILSTASTDESRPVLSGISFVMKDDELLIVSTDGFRLSLWKKQGIKGFESMIIPADFLKELLHIVGNKKSIFFTYSKKENIVSFKIESTTLYTRLIDGEFPPFEKVIPPEKATTVIVKREDILRSTKIISIFARDLSNIIIYTFSKEGVLLSPKKADKSDNTASIEAQFEGEEQKVAFNYRYVIEFLNNTKANEVVFEILRPDAPVVVREKDDSSFMHIIMPVRIQE